MLSIMGKIPSGYEKPKKVTQNAFLYLQVNGRIVLEGVLRVFWGVSCPIQLKPKDDTPHSKSWRRSYSMAIYNGLNDDFLQVISFERQGFRWLT